MRLPAPLSRPNPNVYKNKFGHVLILAGSRGMLGASALTGLAAMRSGAGLTTIGIPASLNLTLQKKIASVIMTLPLNETKKQTLAISAYNQIKKLLPRFSAIALGPGLSEQPSTQKLILKIIGTAHQPLVIDADALNALVGNLNVLKKIKNIKILTPHAGEMARLLKIKREAVESNREEIAKDFARKYECVLILKAHHTIVASPEGKVYINRYGNAGMATAGSGDVLTGILVAFLAQGLGEFEAAKLGTFIHGNAGDIAAKVKTKAAMIASDIIDYIPAAFKKLQH
jgi:NAD(P)H-hydrate epimerase